MGAVALVDSTGDAALPEGQRRGAAGEAAADDGDLGWSSRAGICGQDDAAAGAFYTRLPLRRLARVGEALFLSRA